MNEPVYKSCAQSFIRPFKTKFFMKLRECLINLFQYLFRIYGHQYLLLTTNTLRTAINCSAATYLITIQIDNLRWTYKFLVEHKLLMSSYCVCVYSIWLSSNGLYGWRTFTGSPLLISIPSISLMGIDFLVS